MRRNNEDPFSKNRFSSNDKKNKFNSNKEKRYLMSTKTEEAVVNAASLLLELLIIVAMSCILANGVMAMVKSPLTSVQASPAILTYTGDEQSPEFIVKSNDTELAFKEEYIKSGSWMEEGCGTYTVKAEGVGAFRGEKTCQWKIVQGKAVIDKTAYKDGTVTIIGKFPYLNGYAEVTVVDKTNKQIAQKVLNGTKEKGEPLKISIDTKLTEGKYKVRVKAVSYSERTVGTKTTREIVEEGKSSEEKTFVVGKENE